MSTTAFSTPKRASSAGASPITSDNFDSQPRSSQKELVDHFSQDLFDATWEAEPRDLARALSAKTRNRPFEIGEIDEISNYEVSLDRWDGLLEKIQVPLAPEGGATEESHYAPLAKYLNQCLDNCKSALGNKVQRYNQALRFRVWNKLTNDGVDGTAPIKPDLAGAFNLPEEPRTLSWCPESGKRAETMEIPVEVKAGWPKLIAQAATYARCLMDAVPLRQLSLVIGYEHKLKELRFLCFHAGGLTASRPLRLDTNNDADKKNIMRLFLSLLTWNTRGDAGLPEWVNSSSVYIGRDQMMHIKHLLYNRLGLRGRNVRVLYLEPFPSSPSEVPHSENTSPSLLEPPPPPPKNLPPSKSILPEAVAQTVRRSDRIASQQEKAKVFFGSQRQDINSHPSQSKVTSKKASQRRSGARDPPPLPSPSEAQNNKFLQSELGSSSTRNPPVEPLPSESQKSQLPIKSYDDIDTAIRFVEHGRVVFTKVIAAGSSAVAKLAWVRDSIAELESDMLKECGGMFGVVGHYHSQVVHHQDNVPATNHLYCERVKFWKLHKFSRDPGHPDLRALMQHVSEFAGGSLVKVGTPKHLFDAIIHAMLGYRSLLEKGYQHRDISIGNVLWSKDAKETYSVFETLEENLNMRPEQEALYKLLKQYGINKQCNGFVIDGDMAIKLKTYFSKERKSTRSGTDEFMSTNLLEASMDNERYLQSPLDDLWSFYWVAQWVAVFNPAGFSEEHDVPMVLRGLRQSVAGNHHDREFAATRIRAIDEMDASKYGTFLFDCQPVLKSWYDKLAQLTSSWRLDKLVEIPDDPYDTYYERFKTITDLGITHLIEIVHKHFNAGDVKVG